ncbi:N-acetylglucosamine-6-phosphate deacetylase [Anatilimnocola aggregata]|uniref:N-acetylglucosamine-6-phosphate deacetylase n=1 Tax=Anatilimnocola aggregata TaxID=2528021 RepID=A0A517YIL9_9BACT|nr:N-acetylglucosamine-6-phosphate deacetylase [Anatilimnocola aggregata]QDU30056.1 N-acetylglucosamine-6-phosphate deacetylase [Anatilimnocola aggregata]
MSLPLVFRGQLVLPDRIEPGALVVQGERIQAVLPANAPLPPQAEVIDVEDGFISPGFIDLHVHGGAGGDFMDGTAEAFRLALRANARHGTTRLAATTTVATHEQIMATLEQTRQFRHSPEPNGARVLGAHFYGPYFRYEARGAHPGGPIRPPVEAEFSQYLAYASDLVTATVAPELPGAKEFALACRLKGVRTNVGHSWATFDQMTAAVEWGVRHVDHLYCAMSDKSKLRQFQMYPMQGGVLEATLYYDELTTEVIADGKHLDAGLLLLALKIKGPDRLALVTDTSRALDMPNGQYLIGPLQGGEPLLKQDDVGMTLDGKALASSCMGMDHMVRTFQRLTGRPLWEVIRMASLTPARIAGQDNELGSLEKGKRADVLVLSKELAIEKVFIDGRELSFA